MKRLPPLHALRAFDAAVRRGSFTRAGEMLHVTQGAVSRQVKQLEDWLGKPVFVMLPVGSGLLWYWHDGRGDSPWYPSARLYRQERRGDWAALVERVSADLAAHNLP